MIGGYAAWGRRTLSLCIALCSLLVAREVSAVQCPGAPWLIITSFDTLEDPLPIDVRPWGFLSIPIDADQICTLRALGSNRLVSASIEQTSIYDSGRGDQLIRLVPEEDLAPGTRYEIDCAPSPLLRGVKFETREEDVPSAPPPIFVSAQAVWDRSSRGCCGHGDVVLLTGEFDSASPFFTMGGTLEVRGEGEGEGEGEEVWVSTGEQDGALFEVSLAPLVGSLTIIAVAPDGTRGEPIVLTEDDIKGEPLVGCAITNRPLPLGLALALGWAWFGRRCRRRGGATLL